MAAHAATAEHTLASPPERLAPPRGGGAPVSARPRRGTIFAGTIAVAGLLCFATFKAGGGLLLAPMTVVEIVLTLLSAAIVAGAIVFAPRGTRAHGAWPVALLLAFTALTALSVGWSVVPDSSWQDAGRMLSYSALFAAAAALSRVYPRAWRALLGGVVLSAVTVCVYALLTKVLPHQLDPHDIYARLQEPYGYWNSIGLTAALGTIACLWLGARRDGHGLIGALAYPAMGLLLVTLLLAYSRGALAALAIGVALWMAIVPLRLRGARVLIVGALGALPLVAWAFSKHALSHESVVMAARVAAGRQLGVLLIAMVLVLLALGVALSFSGARRPSSERARRRAGTLLIVLLALALAAGVGALAVSKRGFTGTISHSLRSLTDPNAPVPPNTPGRLTAIGSVRARYWKEALQVFAAHPLFGAGASGYEVARLRYRKETLDVKQAHGYVVQTLADLGLVGLALTLALLAVWLACAARATLPLDRRLEIRTDGPRVLGGRIALPSAVSWRRAHAAYTPERIGLLSMLSVVVAFGVHSFADWTWYVPGNACVALLCAGWLAGRGPLLGRRGAPGGEGAPRPEGATPLAAGGRASGPADLDDTFVLPHAPRRFLDDGQASPKRGLSLSLSRHPSLHLPGGAQLAPRRLALAALVIVFALVAAWTEWQPQRSVEGSEEALALLSRGPAAARGMARAAVSRDPLSAPALFTLAAVQRASGEEAAGRETLQKAVRLQPSNPQTWLELGLYDRRKRPHAALQELRAAVYLDPESIATQNAYVEALRTAPTPPRGG